MLECGIAILWYGSVLKSLKKCLCSAIAFGSAVQLTDVTGARSFSVAILPMAGMGPPPDRLQETARFVHLVLIQYRECVDRPHARTSALVSLLCLTDNAP